MSMTAEQIVEEIKALPQAEREKVIVSVCELSAALIPRDFLEALDDFEHGRFVPIENVALQS
jgi:hypothetical protein